MMIMMAVFISFPDVCIHAGDVVSSRSYKGHENDQDANNLVRVYPSIAGTRLDDCQTCHRAGFEGTDTRRIYNSCEYCHLIPFPDKKYKSGVPGDFEDTLNPFGKAYKEAGRSQAALHQISNMDTDGDGHSNTEEISSLCYPGNPDSKPNQPLAPFLTYDRKKLAGLPTHEQVLLMNTHKQKYDDYVLFKGVRLRDLLHSAGVDLKTAPGVTVFAPDGYSQDLSMSDIMREFPRGTFYRVPEFQDPEKNLGRYPERIQRRLGDTDTIPDSLWLLIAYEADNHDLTPAHYQSSTGRLSGEGPYRLVTPQLTPGRPDRGSSSQRYHDGWDFDETIDHNAGRSVRGACVIRVNPMPEGFEEYDWKNGWSLIDDGKIVIFGHSISNRRGNSTTY